MEGEEPEEGGGPEGNSPVDPSAKPKSKSPTPEVLGSETPRSRSPTPGLVEPEKSMNKSPTPEVLGFDHSMSRSPTPEIPDSALKITKSMTPEVSGSNKSKSKSPTPEVVELVDLKSESRTSTLPPSSSLKSKSTSSTQIIFSTPTAKDSPTTISAPSPKSQSPIPETIKSKLQSSKSMTPEIPESSKSKSPSSEILEPFIPKSKSLTPDSMEIANSSSESKNPHLLAPVSSSNSKTVRIRSINSVPPPDVPNISMSQSKFTQTPDGNDKFPSSSHISTQTTLELNSSSFRIGPTDSTLTKSKISVPEISDLSKSKSKLPLREVSFAESYKTVGEKSQMTELRTSILSGGTASTTNSGTPKVAAEPRTGPVFRGGSLAVFRGAGPGGILQSGNIQGLANSLLQKRNPFIHNPPQPEERRPRIPSPRTPKEYIINLREDLADFQESHGLPRSRDYSFVSLGLALAQETGRAVYSLFQMFTELFPILAIVSLILRFALDKIIEILETTETVPKIKKSVIFALEMMAIVIPLWILIGTIVIPLFSLILSILKKVIRFRGGKRKSVPKIKAKPPVKGETCTKTNSASN